MAAVISPRDLINAAENNDIELMADLLERGGNINAQNINLETPLMAAVRKGNVSMVEFLLKVGTSPYYPTVYINGRYFKNPQYTEKVDLNLRDNYGKTALYLAVLYGNIKIAKMLIDMNENKALMLGNESDEYINIATYAGYTPLFISSAQGNLEMMSLLIHAGANINKYDNFIKAPLIRAIASHKPEAVHFLIKHGARTDMVDRWGRNVDIFNMMRKNGTLQEYENSVREDIERDLSILSLLNQGIWSDMAQIHNSELRSYFQ